MTGLITESSAIFGGDFTKNAEKLLRAAFPGDEFYYFRKAMFPALFDAAIFRWFQKVRHGSFQDLGITDLVVPNPRWPNKISMVMDGALVEVVLIDTKFSLGEGGDGLSLFCGISLKGNPKNMGLVENHIVDSFRQTGIDQLYLDIMLRFRNEYGDREKIEREKPRESAKT